MHNGSISLTGFFLALFSYSYVEYRSKENLKYDAHPAIPIIMAVLLLTCSAVAILSFLKAHPFRDLASILYIMVMTGVFLSPVLIWLLG